MSFLRKSILYTICLTVILYFLYLFGLFLSAFMISESFKDSALASAEMALGSFEDEANIAGRYTYYLTKTEYTTFLNNLKSWGFNDTPEKIVDRLHTLKVDNYSPANYGITYVDRDILLELYNENLQMFLNNIKSKGMFSDRLSIDELRGRILSMDYKYLDVSSGLGELGLPNIDSVTNGLLDKIIVYDILFAVDCHMTITPMGGFASSSYNTGEYIFHKRFYTLD